MYICPNDLMILDPEEMKAYNQEPDACWECYSCVKICPQGAITVDNFLARIDWDKCTACGECAKVCPTGAMVSGDFSGASRVQPYKSRNA